MALREFWPLFGLRINTPRLELRTPTDADLEELAAVALAGVHDPARTPFTVPWADSPSPQLEREALQYWWRCRSETSPERWDIPLAVGFEGKLVGVQNLSAANFLTLRTAKTGSWLGREHQSQGIGKEMRAAAVHFAFECLAAVAVTSAAYSDNEASQRVSLATGYLPNGTGMAIRRGEPALQQRFLLTRARWSEAKPEIPVAVSGFEPCRAIFGL